MSQSGTILETSFTAVLVPSTMRAAVYRGKGSVVVETVPVPAISDGEVLIRVAACGICGTDMKKIEHGFVAAPADFRARSFGTVVAVGAGVTKWKLGDRVMSFHHVPCGACFYCERRLYSQCPGYKKVGLTAGFDPNGGGFAQFVRAMPWVAERGMVAIPGQYQFRRSHLHRAREYVHQGRGKGARGRGRDSCGHGAWADRPALDDAFEARAARPLSAAIRCRSAARRAYRWAPIWP